MRSLLKLVVKVQKEVGIVAVQACKDISALLGIEKCTSVCVLLVVHSGFPGIL